MKAYKRVALIGLDGSGKSANISKMKEDPEYNEFSFVWVRWKPILLKPAYIIMNKGLKRGKKETNAASANTMDKSSVEQKQLQADYKAKSGLKNRIFKKPIVRTIWLTMALVDYLVQFYVKTGKRILKKENLIFDRFYLDLFVDQGINFGYTPEEISKEIDKYQCLFPDMNQMVYLRVSPEVCYQRKDDIPNMDYLLRRYEIYEYLAKKNGWCVINGELPFEHVYQSIKRKILH